MEALLRFAITLLALIILLFVGFELVLPALGLSAVWFAVSTFLAVAIWGLWTLRRNGG